MKLKLEREKLKIYVVTNKTIPVLNNDLYVPFQVGNEKDIFPEISRDNSGDNISNRNQNYSELTAAYWLWKNISDVDYIGLCHYRRYFNFYPKFFNIKGRLPVKNIRQSEFLKSQIFTKSTEKQKDKILKYLSRNIVIVPKPINLGMTITKHYKLCHPIKDFEKTLEILEELYPEYKEKSVSFFNTATAMIPANMFISSKQFWDNYHEWLFSILFEVEKVTEISNDPYQRRIFGFISERLFNLYLIYNKSKTVEFGTYLVEV